MKGDRSQNDWPSLPPKCENNPVTGILKITISDLQLFELSPRPITAKLRIWGLKMDSKLFMERTQQFEIKAKPKLFRQYLRDMKIMPISFADERNEEEIGSGFVNWRIYLKKPETDGGPFLDNEFTTSISITNYRKKMVGECLISIKFEEIKAKLSSDSLSVQEIDKEEQSIRYKQFQPFPDKKSDKLQPPRTFGKKVMNELHQNQSYLKEPERKVLNHENFQKADHQKAKKDHHKSGISYKGEIRYSDNQYELEMTKLRLESQEFLANHNQFSEENHRKEKQIQIMVSQLKLAKANLVIEYLDLMISQKSGEKKHIRVYPSPKPNHFEMTLTVEKDDLLQIEAGKAMGGIDLKSLTSSKFVTLYSAKSQKIGTIKISKILKQNVEKMPRETVVKTNEKEKQKNSEQEDKIDEKIPQIQPLFALITIKEAKHYYLSQYCVWIRNYSFQKPYPSTCIIPLSELGSLSAIEIRSQQNQTVQSALMPALDHIKGYSESLACLTIYDGSIRMEEAHIELQFCIGNMKQVNYSLGKIKAFEQTQGYAPKYPKQKKGTRNYLSKESESDQIGEESPMIQAQKKVYTEGVNPRVETEQVSVDKPPEDQQPDPQIQNIYLVEILSRLLHLVPLSELPAQPPSTATQLQSLFLRLVPEDEKELAQIITDMFVEQEKIEYDEFIKCLNSYHNFVELWWQIRVNLLESIINLEPDLERKLHLYSQLGTISRQMLWRKVLPKADPALKIKLEKSYRISQTAPFPIENLLRDLGKMTQNMKQYPQEISPDLVSDLSRLIRDTIEGLINDYFEIITEERVNIKIMCDIMDKLGISLSYWESLMLIQELKGWYNIDLELGEGIIASSTVQVWLKSVCNRKKTLDSSQIGSQNNLTVEKQALEPQKGQQQIFEVKKQEIAVTGEERKPREATIQNKSALSQNPSQKLIENKSIVKSQLNEEQIFNIANLLRENDNFRMHTGESQAHLVHLNNQSRVPNQRILESGIADISQEQSEEEIKNHHETSTKFLLLKVKTLKTKIQGYLSFPLKISICLYEGRNHFFYLKSFEELEGRELVQQLDRAWMSKTKGLKISLNSVADQEDDIKLHGILLADEITASKNKTIVLYSGKNIVGKVTVEMEIKDEKPRLLNCQKEQAISIEINCAMGWEQFIIRTQSNRSLTALRDQVFNLTIGNDFYKETLRIEVEGVGECLVPLEELYFRAMVDGDYPVITEEGIYQGTLKITLKNPRNIIKETTIQQNHAFNTMEPEAMPSEEKYLLIFDQLCTLQAEEGHQRGHRSICANIFVKNALTRNLLYRSPFYIEHQISSVWNCTPIAQFSNKNYFSLSSQKITIQLEYEGRHLATGSGVLQIDNKAVGKKVYSLKFFDCPILMEFLVRVVSVPDQFCRYNTDRIEKELSRLLFNYRSLSSENQTVFQEELRSLTLTEKRLFKKLVEQNGWDKCLKLQICDITPEHWNRLVEELIFQDLDKTGSIPRLNFKKIVTEICGREYLSIVDCLYPTDTNVDYCLFLAMASQGQNRKQESVVEEVSNLHREILQKYK